MSRAVEEKPRGKSRYARKLARKVGWGAVDPRWMWWIERTNRPTGATAFRPELEGGAT